MSDFHGPVLPDWVLNLIAGLVGGAVRAATQPQQGWVQRIITSFVGGAVAVYMTPIVAPIVQRYVGGNPTDYAAAAGFCGFLLGMSGLAAADMAIKVIRKRVSGNDSGQA